MDGARYDVMLAAMVVPVYHFERWLLCGKARLYAHKKVQQGTQGTNKEPFPTERFNIHSLTPYIVFVT